MKEYSRRRQRHKGNILITVTAVVLICAAVGVLIFLIKKTPPANKVMAPQSSASSSSKPSSSSKQSSSSTPSSSSQSSSTQSSSQKTSSVPTDPNTFKNSVFIGDSLTDGLGLYGVMDDATVIGETGMSTYTACTHTFTIEGKKQTVVKAAAAKSPECIYIMLGANDVAGFSTTTSMKYYGKLIDQIESSCPNAKIYVQSALPMSKSGYKAFNGKRITSAMMEDFNTALKQLCSERNLTYLDVASVMKGPDGNLPAGVSSDGMHINKEYYEKWFAYLASNK